VDSTDGTDLASLADGTVKRQFVVSQFGSEQRGIYMIVNREWKYIYSAGDQAEFLFDRLGDPHETRNKAGLPMLKETKQAMKAALLDYLKRENADDAIEESDGALDWRRYPKLDMSYLDDPDAGLLVQDHDARVLDQPGYTSALGRN
jgi:arylsulfatase A-like enzyme